MKYKISYILLLSIVLLMISCIQVNLSDARDQYVNGEYWRASESYRELYRDTPREQQAMRAVISFEMGEVNRKLNRSSRALTSYKNAIRFNYPDTLMYLYYAKMLHREGEYGLAIEAYNDFLNLSAGNLLAINGIKGAKLARVWNERPTRYKVEGVNVFNTGRSEFSPYLAQNDEVIYFTSSGEDASGEERSYVTGMKYNDIFTSKKNYKGEWQNPEPLKSDINSEFDEGTPSITTDGRNMFYTVSYADTEQSTRPEIYISRRINGVWTQGIPFEINNKDSLSIFAHPSISPTGRYLYFVSDMPGGYGGKDIWRASLSSSFTVISFENLGPEINSPGDEMFPYLRDDNRFYFSSDGHPGMGGLDLFTALYDETTSGWQVENMKSPINSSQDDFGIVFERNAEKGYLSSNRNDVRGYDHIYSFEYLSAKINVEGFAVDHDDEFVGGVSVSVVGSNGLQHNLITNSKGEYQFEAERDVSYILMASADGFLNKKQTLHTSAKEIDTVYYVDFELIPYNKPVVLENIFYDFDSATLSPESEASLDELVTLLNEHPEIHIELSANTDRFGDEKYNNSLSARRAQTVANYLSLNGVDGSRLKAVGYGKSNPKVVNKSLAGRYDFLEEGDILSEKFIEKLTPEQQEISDQLNRRTDFMVLNPKENILMKSDSPK